MRTTDLDATSARLRSLQSARARVDRAQTVAASGLRNVKGSDDPAWLDGVSRIRSEGVLNDRSRASLASARSQLEASDTALASLGDVLARVQEIAVQGGTDTYSASDRKVLADEVRSLKAQALVAANARSGDAYVFGGYRSSTPPFDATGAFVGDSNVAQVDAGHGKTAAAAIDATRVFSPAGGAAIFSVFDALAQGLDTSNGVAIRATLGDVQLSIDQVATGRGASGDAMNVIDRFASWLDDAGARLSDEKAKTIDADPLEAYSALASASSALEAALKVAAQATKLSLVDFL